MRFPSSVHSEWKSTSSTPYANEFDNRRDINRCCAYSVRRIVDAMQRFRAASMIEKCTEDGVPDMNETLSLGVVDCRELDLAEDDGPI